MVTVSIEDIQKDLRGYLRQVESGETLLIVDSDKPVAEVKPVESPSKGPRPFGPCAGEFQVPEDFNDPLPDEILDQFGYT